MNKIKITDYFLSKYFSYVNPSCWNDIHQSIISIDDYLPEYYFKYQINKETSNFNKIKGTIFEYITKYVLLNTYQTVYLYDEIPVSLKSQLNLPKNDKGIDLIVSKDNIEWIAIQSKWRAKDHFCIKKCYVTEFIHAINTSNLSYGILFTNSKKITNGFDSLKWYLHHDLEKDITKDLISKIISNPFSQKINETIEIKELRPYQIEAVNALLENKDSRKKCIMACGSGKTNIMIDYLVKNDFNNPDVSKKVGLFFPSLQLINQVYKLLKQYFSKLNILCICSQLDTKNLTNNEADETEAENVYKDFLASDYNHIFTTDIDIINQRLLSENIIILCTYHSSFLLKDQELDIGIFDEAHKTVNNKAFGYLLDDSNCKISERLFFTATPRYYKKRGNDDEETISMDNKNIYGSEVYNYSFKRAISEGYILDFKLISYVVQPNLIDIVNEKYILKDNLNVKSFDVISALQLAYSIKNYGCHKRILTYHNTVNNAKHFKKILEYIFDKEEIKAKIFVMSGKDRMSYRSAMIKEFEEGDSINVICSAKVLNEGIDIQSVDTVMFVEPRKSTIDIIQCIGRAMRPYKDMKECYIIVPIHYDKIEEKHNYSNMIDLLKSIVDIDDSIVEFFNIKNESNKIIIRDMNIVDFKCKKSELLFTIDDITKGLKCVMVDRSVFSWEKMFDDLKKYVEKNNKLPSFRDKDKNIKRLGTWSSYQNANYKNNSIKNEERRRLWNEFRNHHINLFLSFDEKWDIIFEKLKTYVNNNNKLPSTRSKNKEIKTLSMWVSNQNTNYKNKYNLMKNEERRIIWAEFRNKHKNLFFSVDEKWNNNFEKIKKYIIENKKLPNKHSKNNDVKILGMWISEQNTNYKNKDTSMKNEERRKLWDEFKNYHKNLFLSDEQKWNQNYENVKTYINNNNKLPSEKSKITEIKKLGCWLTCQNRNYKMKIKSMKNEERRNLLDNLKNEYKDLFLSVDERWDKIFENLKIYVKDNKKLPSEYSKNKEIKTLGIWVSNQKQNYKKKIRAMKNETRRNQWEEFKESLQIFSVIN